MRKYWSGSRSRRSRGSRCRGGGGGSGRCCGRCMQKRMRNGRHSLKMRDKHS